MSWVKKLLDWFMSLFWKKNLEISVIGLQNAGKSTLINTMSGDFDMETMPTVGFNLRHLKKGGVNLNIWDLGGQKQFRESWEKYCRTSDVIMFVVDSADFANVDIARFELQQLLASPALEGIPLLVLGNKNDLENALPEDKLATQLQLDKLANRKIAVFSISAKMRVNIDVPLRWISELPKRAH